MNNWDSVHRFVKSQIDRGNFSSEDLRSNPEVVPYCESTMPKGAKITFFKVLMGVQYGITVFVIGHKHEPAKYFKSGGIVCPNPRQQYGTSGSLGDIK